MCFLNSIISLLCGLFLFLAPFSPSNAGRPPSCRAALTVGDKLTRETETTLNEVIEFLGEKPLKSTLILTSLGPSRVSLVLVDLGTEQKSLTQLMKHRMASDDAIEVVELDSQNRVYLEERIISRQAAKNYDVAHLRHIIVVSSMTSFISVVRSKGIKERLTLTQSMQSLLDRISNLIDLRNQSVAEQALNKQFLSVKERPQNFRTMNAHLMLSQRISTTSNSSPQNDSYGALAGKLKSTEMNTDDSRSEAIPDQQPFAKHAASTQTTLVPEKFLVWAMKIPPLELRERIESGNEWFGFWFSRLTEDQMTEMLNQFPIEARLHLKKAGIQLPALTLPSRERVIQSELDAWIRFQDFKQWVLMMPQSQLNSRILPVTDWFTGWFANLRQRFRNEASKSGIAWWNFFTLDVLQKLYATKYIELPDEVVSLLKQQYGEPMAGAQANVFQRQNRVNLESHSSPFTRFHEWLEKKEDDEILELFASDAGGVEDRRMVEWVLRLKANYSRPFKINNLATLQWYHMIPYDDLLRLSEVESLKVPAELVAEARARIQTKRFPKRRSSIDFEKLNSFVRWVDATSDKDLREQILRVDLQHKFWFISMRRNHPGDQSDGRPGWWTFFPDRTIAKIAKTKRVKLPKVVLDRLGIEEYIPQLNGGPSVEIEKVKAFEAWILTTSPEEVSAKIKSLKYQPTAWFTFFRYSHPGPKVNGRPGWWTFFTPEVLSKIQATNLISIDE